MEPVDVTSNMYIDIAVESNYKDPKFEVANHIIIFKYKNVVAKGHASSWSEEVFGIKKAKNIVPGTYVIEDP